MQCLREACDFVIAMAADINRDVFIASLKPVYEEFGGWNNAVKGKLLLAYYKKPDGDREPVLRNVGMPRQPRGLQQNNHRTNLLESIIGNLDQDYPECDYAQH